jgi:outer membrane receptor protein involved in Fe transport
VILYHPFSLSQRITILKKALFLVLISLFAVAVQAQTTGKIAGVITDEAGNPLPGVNVLIEGTLTGNSTDANGNYFILNVRPGSYTLLASFIGFSTVRITDVQVQVDRTTTINISMKEEVIEGEEVVVVAQSKLVTMDQTSASAKVSGDELLKLPVQNFVQTVSAQAGVSQGQGGSLHIRGGRSSEIKYYVDGIAVSNPYSNGLAIPVENTAVQEVEVISGTYNAEYGQANSGIVNIVTRDGSDEFKGTFIGSLGSYITGDDQVFYELDEASYMGEQSYEGSLSGPILRNRLSFFSSLKVTDSDGWLYGRRVFLPSDSSNFSSNNFENWLIESTGDSSVVPMNSRNGVTAMGKLTLRLTQGLKMTYSLTRSSSQAQFYSHLYRLNPEYLPTQRSASWNHLLSFNHVLNSRTFYNIRLTAYTTDLSQYVYKDPFDERYRVIEGRSGQPANVFSTGGVNNYHLDRTSTTYAGRFDITRQFGLSHLVKAGVEYRVNDLNFEEFFIQARRVDNFERRIPPLTSRLHNAYQHKPIEVAAFLQDKIEIESLIVNVGLRFDYFDSKALVPTDPRDPANTAGRPESEAYQPASAKWQFSPRLGFAFPISDRGVIHASYGQFFQIPEFSRLYENPEFEVQSSNFTQFLGNADLEPQRSTTYEIGLQQQLSEYVAIDLTAYYRDVRELIGTTLYEARTGGDAWGRYENTDFGRVRGITLSTEIRSNIGLTGSVNYTFQLARGNASDPKQAFYDAQQNNESSRNLIPLDWDQQHNISGTLTYTRGDFTAGLLAFFNTGYPFTPEDIQRNDIDLLRNQARYSEEFVLNLRAAYGVDLFGIRGQVFFLGENLLNFYRQDREPKIFLSEIDAHNNNGNSLINSLVEFKTNPVVQKPPRLIRIGLQFDF